MKRTFALMIAVLMLACCALPFAAGAEDKTDPAYIYFTPPTEGGVAWAGYSMVYCHMWSKYGGNVYDWQTKNEKCEDLGNGCWRYDLSEITFDEKGEYSLIFSNENGQQTYNLNITSACKGDIVYCDGKTQKNPVDGTKQCAVARWQNHPDVHPAVEVDSQGDTINIDEIDLAEVETAWGTAEGGSYEMPEIESVKADVTSKDKKDDKANEGEKNPDGINLNAATLWIIIVCVVVACAVIAVVVYLGIKNGKKK